MRLCGKRADGLAPAAFVQWRERIGRFRELPRPQAISEDYIVMPKVTFVNEKREIEIPEGANLREEALKSGIQMNFQPGPGMQTLSRYLHCRGHGTCGTCLILVKKGLENLAPKSGWEKFR